MLATGADTPRQQVEIFGSKTPLPTQTRFLNSSAARKVYIGPLGSGKTEVQVWQAIILSHFYAPNFGMVGRQTYPELRDTTRKRFIALTPPSLIKSISAPDNGGGHIEWKVGGATIFRHLKAVNSLEFGSLDLGYCGIDEITEVPLSSISMLEGRVGRHWSTLGVLKENWPYSPLYGGGNPGGHDHVWKLWFSPKRDKAMRDMYEGFQPDPKENEANLPPDYYVNLARGKADWWIRRFLRGDMRTIEGLVWPQFQDDVNGVDPFPIPATWRRRMGFDHGRRNPTAAQWWVADPEGNIICYRDYEVSGPTPKEHRKAFAKLEKGETIELRPSDPSIFNKTLLKGDKWFSVAEEYAEHGLDLDQGDNAMDASLTRCGMLLWADPQHRFPQWHPKAGQRGSPRAFFFNSCERSIEAVSSWKYKEFSQDAMGLREEPVDVDDHLCDCFRYVALSFPEPTEEERPVVEPTRNEWQIARKKQIGRSIRKSTQDAEMDQWLSMEE